MYLSGPTGECHGAILVLHSWWGLNGFFRRLCDRFAKEGFLALAPDLYDGKVAANVAEAKALRARASASRREPAYRQLMGATAELREAAAVDAVGVVGYSMGGHWRIGSRNARTCPSPRRSRSTRPAGATTRPVAQSSWPTSPRLTNGSPRPRSRSWSATWPRQGARASHTSTPVPPTGSPRRTGRTRTAPTPRHSPGSALSRSWSARRGETPRAEGER